MSTHPSPWDADEPACVPCRLGTPERRARGGDMHVFIDSGDTEEKILTLAEFTSTIQP